MSDFVCALEGLGKMVYYNFIVCLLLFFVALAIDSIGYDNLVLPKVIAALSKHSNISKNRSNGARNTSSQMLMQL